MVGDEYAPPMLDRHPHDSEKIAWSTPPKPLGWMNRRKTPFVIKKMPPFGGRALVAEGNADVLVSETLLPSFWLALEILNALMAGRCALGSVFPTEIAAAKEDHSPYS